MTSGIQIFNDLGKIQIDENHSNLAVKSKGSAVINQYGYISTFKIAGCVTPMIALKANGTAGVGIWFDADGTTLNVGISGTPGLPITWYLFDVVKSSPDYGFVIYKVDGSIAFDATKQQARVVDVRSGSSFTSGDGATSYPSGRNYAHAIFKAGYYTLIHYTPDDGAPENGNYYGWLRVRTDTHSTFTWSGTQLTVGSKSTDQSIWAPKDGPYVANNTPSWIVLVLDVTDY